MARASPTVSNNLLATLAIMLIIISTMNYFISQTIKSRSVTAAGTSSISGQLSLCAGLIPQITTTGQTFSLNQYDRFYQDANATGEETGNVMLFDNTTMFNIDQSTGVIDFVASSEYDVGVRDVAITASETVCNYFNYSVNLRFNITNVNDPPSLVMLFIKNLTSPKGNMTYTFPITKKVEFWEDVLYNVSLTATDPDLMHGDTLIYAVVWYDPDNPDIQVGDLFTLNETTGNVTFMPLQADVGDHIAEFWVWDRMLEVEKSDKVEVEVKNVNEPPVMLNKTVLMAQTAYSGEPFVLDMNATDEDGDKLYFSADFLSCLKINTSDHNCTIFYVNETTGIINFTPRVFDVGNYSVNYTVSDGLARDWVNGTFTVVEFANHPPNITDWYPFDYNVTMYEGYGLNLSIIVYDPDSGWNTASVQWYFDGKPLAGENGYSHTYYPGYTASGVYNATVVVSDGEYYDSHEWRVIVLDRIPPTQEGRGGMGIVGKPVCLENWRCTTWSECSREGIEMRVCVDVSSCNTTKEKPSETRNCTYTAMPTCYDSVRNCHDGGCEILTDCGGPCSPCPTCSDGIRNCHVNGECEEGIDCGGPCRPCPGQPTGPGCGNQICEAGELYECIPDCMEFWIDTAIFMLILILLIVMSILLYVYRKETVLLYLYRKVRGE